MNKERAIEILEERKTRLETEIKEMKRMNKYRLLVNQYNTKPKEKEVKALDLAIESLDQEINIEDCIIELQAFNLTLKDLTEVDHIEESIFNTSSNIIKQIIERLEPYKRKE